HTDLLVQPDGQPAQRRLLDRPAVLVSPGCVGEQPLDGQVNFLAGGFQRLPGHGGDAPRELVGAGCEVLRDVVQYLRPVVAGALRPVAGRLARRLDRIADVLAVALAHLTEDFAARPGNHTGIGGVGPLLLAADVHLRRAVNGVEPAVCGRAAVQRRGQREVRLCPLRQPLLDVLRQFRARAGLPRRADVLEQPFLPALAAKPALAVAAKARGGIKQVRRVDPDRARLQLPGDVDGDVDVVAPDAGCQPVAGVVRQLDGLRRGAEGHRDQHRPEDLFLHDAGAWLDAREQRRRVEAALLRHGDVRLVDGRALLDAALHPEVDGFALLLVHNRADIDALVERVA